MLRLRLAVRAAASLRCHRPLSTASSLSSHAASPRIWFGPDGYSDPHISLALPNTATTTYNIQRSLPVAALLAAIKDEAASQSPIHDIHIRDGRGGPGSLRWANATIADDLLRVAAKKGGLTLVITEQRGNGVAGESLAGVAAGSGAEAAKSPVTSIFVPIEPLEERVTPLKAQLKELRDQLRPLAVQKEELDRRASSRASNLTRAGFAIVTAQLVIMCRLIYWEFSWDVMEPIGYLISTATGVLGYAFFLFNGRDYTYEALHHTTVNRFQSSLYKQRKFDMGLYLDLKSQVQRLDDKLRNIEGLYKEEE